MAKNYLSINAIKFFQSSKMMGFILKNRGDGKTRKLIKMFFRSLFICIECSYINYLLDFLRTLYFIELQVYKTNFNIIFLTIAHIQHQFWNFPNKKFKQMRFGLIYVWNYKNVAG